MLQGRLRGCCKVDLGVSKYSETVISTAKNRAGPQIIGLALEGRPEAGAPNLQKLPVWQF